MEDIVKQRVREFISTNDISVNAISRDTGYPQSNLNKQINKDTAMSVNTILVLLEHFPNLSAEWLLRGEGEMLKERHFAVDAKLDNNQEENSLDKAELVAIESMIPYYEEVIKAKDSEILKLHKEMYILKKELEKVSKTA